NIHTQRWDSELCSLLRVPESMLPLVMDNVADFGETRLFGGPIPVCGMAGDQQAATVGQACFSPGEAKSTYGTGCFLVLNTGSIPVPSTNKLLTTVAWRLNGNVTYALEGSIFSAGSAVQWLRDGLKLIEKAPESENIARSISSTDGVYLVPAFTGLGAPYWDPHARGGVFGITRDTGVAHLVRAALESVCYQTRDLLDAMGKDRNEPLALLKVDGGMVGNDWLLQYLADICAVEVDRPAVIETTALGAAYLAGLGCGIYDSLDEIAALWRANGHFKPSMSASMRAERLEGWHRAVVRVLD
ncbi:MAG: FGGY-family carbohydrate kinase, partial [Pseudomonadota bacterium]|nr:FGGY-family carbohydrate kinase [Pseudomonadota bacterium]